MAVSKDKVISELYELFEQSEKNGISLEDILKCVYSNVGSTTIYDSYDELPTPCAKESYWRRYASKCIHFFVLQLLPILFLGVLFYSPVAQLVYMSPCILHTPVPLVEVTHPIINCTMCQGLTEAPRLKNLSRNEFMEHHAHSLRPIVVVGAASQWPAIEVFSYDYFKKLYQNYPESVEGDMNTGQFFSYSSNIRNLKELFEIPHNLAVETERWYIGWSTSDPHIGQEIASHIITPDFLPPEPTGIQLAWIFMGAPGPGASMHIDSVGVPSWQAQLSGTKTWTLTPPVECDNVCSSFNVTVHRGDIIVLDTNRWYHQTYIHPGNISITIGSEYHR